MGLGKDFIFVRGNENWENAIGMGMGYYYDYDE
jgi:hypothetical protein